MRPNPAFIRGMFAAIATKYDLLNGLLSFGLDRGWRKFAALRCRLPPGGLVLDAATGTGGLALRLARQDSSGTIVGVDFSPQMLARAKSRLASDSDMSRIRLVLGDVLRLPFPDSIFDCVATGFALRNVEDLASAFREMTRVARPGGRVVALENTRPSSPMPRAIHYLYLHHIVSRLGGLLSGNKGAYVYLSASIRRFQPSQEVKQIMEGVGLRQVEVFELTFGAATVFIGVKDSQPEPSP
ncbi:MAG: ubiquinone/menaquinone biosynthesis methyltransferase [Chloroflexi bacterium]|nr:ubiquinone/menaquinone biosynthesis methyltransferase [Chloroflexota bacterium]